MAKRIEKFMESLSNKVHELLKEFKDEKL